MKEKKKKKWNFVLNSASKIKFIKNCFIGSFWDILGISVSVFRQDGIGNTSQGHIY